MSLQTQYCTHWFLVCGKYIHNINCVFRAIGHIAIDHLSIYLWQVFRDQKFFYEKVQNRKMALDWYIYRGKPRLSRPDHDTSILLLNEFITAQWEPLIQKECKLIEG